MKKIPLTQGKFALVDNEDFDWLSQWKWCAHNRGNKTYAVRNKRQAEGRGTIQMHQVISGFDYIDHIDGNGLNNQKRNLRSSTNSENQRNRGKPSNNTSGFKGVHKIKGYDRWEAYIYVNKHKIHLGRFDSAEEAAKVYNRAVEKYHGEFARFNII